LSRRTDIAVGVAMEPSKVTFTIGRETPVAAERYRLEMRAHFDRYKMEFQEGYSLPDPPTPELRFIYDSAAQQEGRPTSPDGTVIRAGFSGGEYHWRPWPLSNVWLGVSVENQHFADERIPLLLQTPAAVRFLSVEPLLGPVTFRWAKWDDWTNGDGERRAVVNEHDGLRRLDWVIVGGESGPSARPMHPDWPRSIRDQCQAAGVAYFFKQWGEWKLGSTPHAMNMVMLRDGRVMTMDEYRASFSQTPGEQNPSMISKVGKKTAGRLLDGREWNEMPAVSR
jgi:protein gp37